MEGWVEYWIHLDMCFTQIGGNKYEKTFFKLNISFNFSNSDAR